MRAALFEAFGERINVERVEDPAPPSGGVVLQVLANGVCRSDWHGWMGHDPFVPLPHVPGHEMAGTIVAADANVSKFSVGDVVTVPFALGCGECAECRSGNQQICDNQYQPGFSGWGSFAEFVALPFADENLVALPEGMDAATAAGLGCRFATSFRAVVDQANVGAGDTVAIWGCGGVGLSAVMIAAALGAEVFALDISEDALTLASQVGATHTMRVDGTTDQVKRLKDMTDGGVRVAIDALGSRETSVSSIRSLRKRGRHIQVGLMIGEDARPVIPMWMLHQYEIELFGSHGMQAWRYPAMLDMVSEGTLNPQMLVTERLSLTGGVDHLTKMASFPGTGFAVIEDFAS